MVTVSRSGWTILFARANQENTTQLSTSSTAVPKVKVYQNISRLCHFGMIPQVSQLTLPKEPLEYQVEHTSRQSRFRESPHFVHNSQAVWVSLPWMGCQGDKVGLYAANQ